MGLRNSGGTLVGIAGVVLGFAACGDLPTASRKPVGPVDPVITLPVLEVTTCQYGGDYPFCRSAPPSGGETGPGGGGTNPPPPDSTTTECDPQLDPTCEIALTEKDKRVLQTVIGKYRRPSTAFTNPQARDACESMANKFSQMFAAGAVFRGSTDTHEGDPGISVHMGAYDPATGHIHFDPSYLDKAATGDAYWERDLANDALHEAAHALGFEHGDSTPSPWGPIYSDSPFNLLSPGSNSCLNWS